MISTALLMAQIDVYRFAHLLAYSAPHRAFFRVLAGKEFEALRLLKRTEEAQTHLRLATLAASRRIWSSMR